MSYVVTKKISKKNESVVFGINWCGEKNKYGKNRSEVIGFRNGFLVIRKNSDDTDIEEYKEISFHLDEALGICKAIKELYADNYSHHKLQKVKWLRKSGFGKITKKEMLRTYSYESVTHKWGKYYKLIVNLVNRKIDNWTDVVLETQFDKIQKEVCFQSKEEAEKYIENIKLGNVIFMRQGVIFNGFSDG